MSHIYDKLIRKSATIPGGGSERVDDDAKSSGLTGRGFS